jgi:hypothetical protein
MFGPKPPGFWVTPEALASMPAYRGLDPGTRYQVVVPFTDYDGVLHPPGETWTYLGHNYHRFDNGLSLFVSLDGVHQWHIRMWNDPDGQQAILDALDTYLVATPE